MSPKKLVQRVALTGLALSALAFVGAACGDDDDGAAAEAEVRAAVEEQLAAEKSGNADIYLDHVTDQFLTKVVGATRDAVKADPSIFQSDDDPTIGEIKVSGDKATVAFTFGDDPTNRFVFLNSADLVKEDGKWKMDAIHVLSAADVPSASKKVDVALTDFAFGFDRSEITSKDDLVFHVENNGKQYHMMIVSKIPADADLDKLLEFEGEGSPPGVEDVGGIFLFSPGDKADVVLKEKLAAGRYVFLCFVADEDDPEHAPHVAKGMVADFEVK